MKKILLSTIALTAFSFSIILFQISCKKSADAATPATSTSITQQNKIIYQVFTNQASEIWTANYDGTNQQKLNISLPTNVVVAQDSGIKLSPDEKTIFFTAFILGGNSPGGIYSCNIDGTNAKQIISGGTYGNSIGVAY